MSLTRSLSDRFFLVILVLSRIPLVNICWRPSTCQGFPGGIKVSACQCRRCKRHGFNPWVLMIPLEEGVETHSSTLAWRIPWTEEPDGPRSMGSQWVWATDTRSPCQAPCRSANLSKEALQTSLRCRFWSKRDRDAEGMRSWCVQLIKYLLKVWQPSMCMLLNAYTIWEHWLLWGEGLVLLFYSTYHSQKLSHVFFFFFADLLIVCFSHYHANAS